MKENTQYKDAVYNYTRGCNDMLFAFCERHDFEYDEDCWVGGEPGGVAALGDFFFNMQTIFYDVTAEPPVEELLKWEDYTERLCMLGIDNKMNFESWCKGAPRVSDEHINRLHGLYKELEDSVKKINEGK